ncbi:hypothetical protein DMENIID0001_073680 [Sergentomyia squamirostris]
MRKRKVETETLAKRYVVCSSISISSSSRGRKWPLPIGLRGGVKTNITAPIELEKKKIEQRYDLSLYFLAVDLLPSDREVHQSRDQCSSREC